MPEIPRHIIEQIRESADLVQVVGQHVKLEKAGANWKGLCPFHQEKTPSFHVLPDKAIYYCFGCQETGDVFTFLQKVEGLSFVEAVKEMGQAVGVEVEQQQLTAAQVAALQQRATLHDVLEEAASFYESVLWTRPEGEPARQYLSRRGMGRETARQGRMGFAPDGWTPLLDHLHRRGFSPDLALKTGLARQRKSGDGHYDAFRNRVMFPIRDDRGRVIAFGGRLLEGDGPKYINTPETEFYDKSRTLYGLYTARRIIQRKDRVLVVEGYFDVLSLHQVGLEETVATCGTALTAAHMERLRRHTRNVIVLMDADAAGQRAAERTLPLFLGAGIRPSRLSLPEGKDPDDVAREGGAEAMEAAIATKEPLLDWVVQRKLDANGRDPAGRAHTLEEMASLLVGLPNALVSGVAEALHIDEKIVHDMVRRQPRGAAPEAGAAPPRLGWRPEQNTVHLLWLLVHHPSHTMDVLARVDRPELLPRAVLPAVARLMEGVPVATVLAEEPDSGVHRTLAAVVARDALYTEAEARRAACDILVKLDRPARERRRGELDTEIATAGRTGEEYRTLLLELKGLNEWIWALDHASDEQDLDRVVALLAGGP